MSWRDELRPGAFRGVAFLIEAADATVGRRIALHEYPLRDVPYAEDLGRRARRFSINCFVLGADYMRERDALQTAVEKPGAGTLVHPYYGERRVVVTDCRIRESTREGGMARFSITFTEAGERRQPRATLDTRSVVDARADETLAAAQSDFSNKFSVDGRPEFVADGAQNLLDDTVSTLRGINAKVNEATAPVANFTASLDQFGAELSTLIRTPETLAGDVVSLVGGVVGVASDVEAAINGLKGLFDWGADAAAVPRTTPNRQQQADNQDALIRLVQVAGIAEAVRASARLAFEDSATYASFDEAVGLRDQFVGAIDAITESTDSAGNSVPDDLYSQLIDLRAAAIQDITSRAGDLQRIVSYTPAVTLPALVIAHYLYGDARRAGEIVARNGVVHPGFVTGGRALEVRTAAPAPRSR